MATTAPSPVPRTLRIVTLVVGIIAVVLLLVSGPGTRADLFSWRIGITCLRVAAWLGLAAMALALVQLVVPPWRRAAPGLLLAALILGAVASTPPMLLMSKAKRVPPIHDITTDFADPPAFVTLAAARKDSPNGVAYGGPEVAAKQRGFYPEVYPVVMKLPPAEAFQKALDAARASGWDVTTSDAAAGRIEATDTTRWFGFKDDIVVRVRAVEGGSRIDARSASRVGQSDLGANAERLAKFLAKLS
jgi:uncharacterized protein (DUF1499 family)